MTERDRPRPAPDRGRRTPAAQRSRMLVLGAAVGGGLGLVGLMAAAADQGPPAPTAIETIRQIVVIPSSSGGPDDPTMGATPSVTIELPNLPEPPTTPITPPVTESGGS